MSLHCVARLSTLACFSIALALFTGCSVFREGPLPPNSLATHDSSKWEKDIAKYEEQDRTAPPDLNAIEFIGSSSIRRWSNLAEAFPNHRVFNRGFGGSQLADSVNYAERILIPYKPKQVVIFAGTNDINAGKDPQTVFGDFVALARKIRDALPRTQISYIALSPTPKRWAQINEVREVNRLIEEYCRRHSRMDFIDTATHMLGADGKPMPHIFVADELHLNDDGYAIWQRVIGPHLK